MTLNAKEVAQFNKRMEKAAESRQDFRSRCEDICAQGKDIQENDFFHYCHEALRKYADAMAERQERARRAELGFFGRIGEDVGNLFASAFGLLFGRFFKPKESENTKRDRRIQEATQAIGCVFTTPDQYTEAIDDSQFTHVLWRIMFDTSDGNIDIHDGETEAEAIRRVVKGHLSIYRDACEVEEIPCQDSGRWDEAVQGDGKGDIFLGDKKIEQPEDPLLEYAKKAKLKELLAKDETNNAEKRIIDDAMSGQDIVVLD